MTATTRVWAWTLGAVALSVAACRRDSGPVVARVGDAVVTVSDVQARIDKQPPFVRARYADPTRKRQLVAELVQNEALAAEAARQGYDRDRDVQRVVKQQMVSKLLQKDFESKMKVEDVPDAEVRKYYDDHPAEFHQKAAVGVQAVVVKTKAKADRAYADAQKLPSGPANLEEQQERFRELVSRYDDGSAPKSLAADLLFFYADSPVVSKPITQAAFALKAVGDLAPPIQIEQGWAVIRLTQKRPGINRSLADAKRDIQQRLLPELRAKALDAFVEDLKKKSNITIEQGNLSKVVVEGGAAEPAISLPGPLGSPLHAPHP